MFFPKLLPLLSLASALHLRAPALRNRAACPTYNFQIVYTETRPALVQSIGYTVQAYQDGQKPSVSNVGCWLPIFKGAGCDWYLGGKNVTIRNVNDDANPHYIYHEYGFTTEFAFPGNDISNATIVVNLGICEYTLGLGATQTQIVDPETGIVDILSIVQAKGGAYGECTEASDCFVTTINVRDECQASAGDYCDEGVTPGK